MFLNVFSCEGAVEQALTYMDLTGRGPATRRDMRAFRRVTTGYLSVESYVRSVTDRYEGVHSSSGRKKACRITVPGNRLGTRDGSILATAERKIYPARLVHEFRFGTVPDCTVRDVASLNARLCGDLYPCAGEFRAGTDTGRLDALLSGFRDKILSGGGNAPDGIADMLSELLTGRPFSAGNQITAMCYAAKLACRCGYELRFEASGIPGILCFAFRSNRGDDRRRIDLRGAA